MIGRAEILRSLGGAWRLAKGDPRGMEDFDISADGFWRSFQAILLILPFYLIVTLAERRANIEEAGGVAAPSDGLFFVSSLVGLALDWVMLPLVLFFLANPLGIAGRYAAFVVARNWVTVLAILPYAAASLLYGMGLVNSEVLALLSLVILAVLLRYFFMVATFALGVPTFFAISLVAADFLLSLTIALTVDRAFGV